MVKIYAVVVLGTFLSFFADVAPSGGCCGKAQATNEPSTEKPKDARLQMRSQSPLASRLLIKKKSKQSSLRPI